MITAALVRAFLAGLPELCRKLCLTLSSPRTNKELQESNRIIPGNKVARKPADVLFDTPGPVQTRVRELRQPT